MELPQHFGRALGLHRKTGPIDSLHIFDFDGTLVRTPGPEEGKAKYTSVTGREWTGGWWGKAGSLAPPVVQLPVPQGMIIKTAFNQMEEVVTRSQTAVGIVITGRIRPLRANVLRILDSVCIQAKNDTVRTGESFLHHNAIMTHPGGRMHTLEFKTSLIKAILTSEPLSKCPIKHVHIWEDRQEHAEFFSTTLKDDLRRVARVDTTVHIVTPQTQ